MTPGWPMRLGLVVMLWASTVDAQVVRGSVRDGSSQDAVAGAVVMLQDGSGQVLARTISGAQGQYSLPRFPSATTMRVVRLGYRPRQLALTDAQQFDVALARMATMLEAVTVRDQPNCQRRSDRAAAFALWEQVRAGLLSVVVARDAAPAQVLRLQYYRIVGETRDSFISQTVHGEWASVTRPYASSRGAEELVRAGFRADSSGYSIFFAPDADVLVEDAFTRGYCFHLMTSERRPTQLGLAFQPARTTRGVQVSGTLWVDSARKELVDIDFRYLGLSAVESRLDPGGFVSFVTLANGVAFIDHWNVRVPARKAIPYAQAASTLFLASPPLELHQVGGMLGEARWPGQPAWSAPLGTVRGRVMSGGRPVPNQEVWLVGTDYRAVSDSAGRYEITDIVPGRYAFSVPDSLLNRLGLELTRAQNVVASAGVVTEVDVVLPTARDFLDAKCPPTMLDTVRSLLAVRVLDSRGDPIEALVTVGQLNRADTEAAMWPKIYEANAAPAGLFTTVYEGEIGADGLFYMCRVPARGEFRVIAAHRNEEAVAEFNTHGRDTGIFGLILRMRPKVGTGSP